MNAKRCRIRFHFWLDINKADEAEVADTITELKRERAFSSAVRDGILLIAELRRGKVDKLFELYPWIQDAIGKPKGDTPGGSGDEITLLKERMHQLERLILAGNRPPEMVAQPALPAVSRPENKKASENLLKAGSNFF